MTTPRLASALSLAALLVAAGCKSRPAADTANAADANPTPPTYTPSSAPPASMGTVSGVVKFTGATPARVRIDMSMDPGCAFGADNMSEPYVIRKGLVANVFVYVKSGAQDTTAWPGISPVLLDQKDCRFTPHVIAIQQGAAILFHNSDSTMHNIHAVPTVEGNTTVDLSQPPGGAADRVVFHRAETMIPVRCNNHPWMNAFVNIAPNPFFAVTDRDGSFTIPRLPPGHYVLAAVHEKMGEQEIPLWVRGGTTTKADFTFSAGAK